jgi:hypothetical protein
VFGRTAAGVEADQQENATVIESSWVESSELAAAKIARKELHCDKKTPLLI